MAMPHPHAIHITSALDRGAYDEAEKLIRANNDPGLLNNPYLNYELIIPLAYVLAKNCMNLYLAKLLVESGANPNLRLVYPHYIDDAPGATASPMELLHNLIEAAAVPPEKQTLPLHILIDLHNQHQLAADTPKHRGELLALLDIFLGRGGDPNVRTSMANTTLYHKCLSRSEPDMEVVTRLSQAGGDLNLSNAHGTTPLMDLVKHAQADRALTVLAHIESLQRNVKLPLLEKENCQNETVLWNAGFAGSPGMVVELLKRSANASRFTKSVTIPIGMVHYMSPILAPLLRDSFPHKIFSSASCKTVVWSVPLMNKVMAYSISPIFDCVPVSTCFPMPAVANLQKLTTRLTKFEKESLYSKRVNASEVPVLMFGHLSAGLQQLCIRRIIEQVVTRRTQERNPTEWLNISAIVSLFARLGLPAVLVPRFAIEAARLQLGFELFKARASCRCDGHCENLQDYEDEENIYDMIPVAPYEWEVVELSSSD